MRNIFKHKWSVVSGLTTLTHWAIIYGVTEYLYHRGRWHPDASPRPAIVGLLVAVHFVAVILATGTAIKGVSVEKPRIYAFIALMFALVSFFIFVG